jgi:hypothetical protein
VLNVVRLPCRMNFSASSSTCASRKSTSRASSSTTLSASEAMPTDSATSRTLSGFQTEDMLSSALLVLVLSCQRRGVSVAVVSRWRTERRGSANGGEQQRVTKRVTQVWRM